VNRREFIRLFGSAWAVALSARPLAALAAQNSVAPLSLDAAQWRVLEAVCARILPPVHGVDTGVAHTVNFIDKLLAHEDKAALPSYRIGLAALDRNAQAHWKKDFAALAEPDQVRSLENLEDGVLEHWPQGQIGQQQFFASVRFHTILGFLAAPKFGGNQDFAGWRAIGFPGHLHEMGGISDEQVTGEKPIAPLWHH